MEVCSKKSFGRRLNANVRRAPTSEKITKDGQGLRKGSWFETSEKQAAGAVGSDSRLGRVEK